MAIRLVALDIDGTIIPDGKTGPSERLRKAIAELQSARIAVVLASGRMYPGTLSLARELGISTPLICQQGCAVHRLSGELLHEFPLEETVALELAEYARELGDAYEWFNPFRYVVSRETEASKHYAALSGVEAEYFDAPEELDIEPTGVGVISTYERATHIHKELVRLHGEKLHVLDFPAVTVAVAPDANKGHALSLLCDDMGIDRSDTVAIGDSVNDAAMLAWAGRGIAMRHSDAYAVDAADEQLDEGDDDALARFLERLKP